MPYVVVILVLVLAAGGAVYLYTQKSGPITSTSTIGATSISTIQSSSSLSSSSSSTSTTVSITTAPSTNPATLLCTVPLTILYPLFASNSIPVSITCGGFGVELQNLNQTGGTISASIEVSQNYKNVASFLISPKNMMEVNGTNGQYALIYANQTTDKWAQINLTVVQGKTSTWVPLSNLTIMENTGIATTSSGAGLFVTWWGGVAPYNLNIYYGSSASCTSDTNYLSSPSMDIMTCDDGICQYYAELLIYPTASDYFCYKLTDSVGDSAYSPTQYIIVVH